MAPAKLIQFFNIFLLNIVNFMKFHKAYNCFLKKSIKSQKCYIGLVYTSKYEFITIKLH